MTSYPCASIDPEAWFPEPGQQALPAKNICQSCPHQLPCLRAAVDYRVRDGIWGGINFGNDHGRRQARARLSEAPTMRRALEESFGASA